MDGAGGRVSAIACLCFRMVGGVANQVFVAARYLAIDHGKRRDAWFDRKSSAYVERWVLDVPVPVASSVAVA